MTTHPDHWSPPLALAQRRMHDALIRPDADPAAVRALFADDGRLGAAAGLAIYQRGYVARLTGCMREQFPALCHALGGALFDDFVAAYIGDHPPVRHTLYDLGRRFPEWLEANRPDAAAREAWIDFMIALARFEYAVFAMYDASGHEGKSFAAIDTPDEALRLQPAFALGDHGFPVADYYHAVRRGEQPAMPFPAACQVALIRTDYVVRTIPLDPVHYRFLQAMATGASVSEAIAMTAMAFGVEPAVIQRSWSEPGGRRERWIDWGVFIAAP
ncbi:MULTISPECIES: DNA-binding domain-containing protein [unclassified Sphingomonas]|uniref:DNA-binding domain-containing protein n=1 Tax=unclassified Sphingomonas TaxID=196159 RepID=UPI002867760D|nr:MULTISPECIES: DNA-binding domain-containing protein [unclassified Sphingomonas]MDR6116608.1 hypothetical protein [Sphingomonas sp. SORGH_AS_0789]MDR6149715.1 hypothetical protein [Sphingomonas sp. SORGH_AS_0742]